MKKIIGSIACAITLLVASCGAILKPEQAGKSHSNKLDTTIVLLDSLGLLFFLIPGIIALAVDYSNGTLYLPAGSSKLEDTSAEGIHNALVDAGYDVSLEQVEASLKA